MANTRSMLFPDWDLEAIVLNINTERDDDFSHAVELIQQGALDEADQLLQIEISRYPWVLLAAAHLHMTKGNANEAAKILRAVTLLAQETILELWAWHNLRRLGKNPSPALSDKVLGIVIEVPNEGGSDLLASYADGTARYLNHQGGLIVWDSFDERVTPMIHDGIRMARPMGALEQFHSDEPVPENEIRLTVMTPAGMFIWEGTPENGSDVANLFAKQAVLLRLLVKMVLDQRGESDEE